MRRGSPAAARAECWIQPARPGRPPGIQSGERRSPESPRRAWRSPAGSQRARWRAGNGIGTRGTSCSVSVMYSSSMRPGWSARANSRACWRRVRKSSWSEMPSSCRRSKPVEHSGGWRRESARPSSRKFGDRGTRGKRSTQQLFYGRTIEVLDAYGREGCIHAFSTREGACQAVLAALRDSGQQHPQESQLMLAFTRDDVRELNAQARELRRTAGELGQGEVIATERGARSRSHSPSAFA